MGVAQPANSMVIIVKAITAKLNQRFIFIPPFHKFLFSPPLRGMAALTVLVPEGVWPLMAIATDVAQSPEVRLLVTVKAG
jgi:hypothetical protein